jgi:4-hydroxybenzoate polyprenyltransferase/phosphoserine phosphatase
MPDPALPIVVDLDDTLVRTDTLWEQLVSIVFRRPGHLPHVVGALLRGRASLKRFVAETVTLDFQTLPYHEGVLAYLAKRKQVGSTVHLVTAADQSVADGVAGHLGLFDSATGSNGTTNLKGTNKARAIGQMFSGGYAYIGDCAADLPIWSRAREAVLVGGSPRLRRQLDSLGLSHIDTIARPRPGLAAWLKALRVHQWSKNVIVLVPLLLSQQFRDPAMLARGFWGLMLFCAVASATYLLNDLRDLAADRVHRSKRYRPLAAGTIPIRSAVTVALGLMLGGLAAAFALDSRFGWITFAYAAISLLYTCRLKAEPLIDVLTIGGLFTIRVLAGMILFATPISLWLSTFTFVLFTSLALAKRTAELARDHHDGRSSVVGRGYLAADTQITTPLGVATGVAAIIVMVLYMELEARKTGLYMAVEPLFLIPIVLSAWLLRVWMRAHRGVLQDDPVVFALKDVTSWMEAAAIVLLWWLATHWA